MTDYRVYAQMLGRGKRNTHHVKVPLITDFSAAPVGTPKPYRIMPSQWSPGKFIIKRWTGHANLLFEAQFKLVTSIRFNSVASAMNWLENNYG